jgi:hypothetical protein
VQVAKAPAQVQASRSLPDVAQASAEAPALRLAVQRVPLAASAELRAEEPAAQVLAQLQ